MERESRTQVDICQKDKDWLREERAKNDVTYKEQLTHCLNVYRGLNEKQKRTTNLRRDTFNIIAQ